MPTYLLPGDVMIRDSAPNWRQRNDFLTYDKFTVAESRHDDLRATQIRLHWAHGCACSQMVPDEDRIALGRRVMDVAIDEMVERHASSHRPEADGADGPVGVGVVLQPAEETPSPPLVVVTRRLW